MWSFQLHFLPLILPVLGPLSCFSLSPPRILLPLGLCTCYERLSLLFPQRVSWLPLSLTLGFCSQVSFPVRGPLSHLSKAALGPFLPPTATYLPTSPPYVMFFYGIYHLLVHLLPLSLTTGMEVCEGRTSFWLLYLRTCVNDWYILVAYLVHICGMTGTFKFHVLLLEETFRDPLSLG